MILNFGSNGNGLKLGVKKTGSNDYWALNNKPGTIVLPTHDVDDNALPETWNPGNNFWVGLLPIASKVIIPSTFASVPVPTSTDTTARYGALQELEFNTPKVSTIGDNTILACCTTIKRLHTTQDHTLPNGTAELEVYLHRTVESVADYGDEITIEIDLDNFSGRLFPDIGKATAKTGQRRHYVKFNCPQLKILGTESGYNRTWGWFGNVKQNDGVFPKVISMGGIGIPYQGDSYFRLPKLDKIPYDYTFFRDSNNTGTLHIYVGPWLTTFHSSAISKALTNASYIDWHIPAGLDKTTPGNTAYTLTQAGITYAEDYDYEADL